MEPDLIKPDSAQSATLTALQTLIEVVAQLRSPNGGCPWDLAQTPETLIPYVIEEAYEVVDAIRQGNPADLADELGDLLLQVVLQAQIASEAAQFDLSTVAAAITAKLIRRHPHVFGDVKVANVEEVKLNWEAIKATEKSNQSGQDQLAQDQSGQDQLAQTGTDQIGTNQPGIVQANPELGPRLSRYARSLPPLTAAIKISRKAAAVGFEWENVEGVWAKFHEELAEFEHALQSETKAAQQAELGDLLFTLVNLARWYDLDPDEALNGTNQRFINRLSLVEQAADRPLANYTIDELEQFWQRAKARLGKEE